MAKRARQRSGEPPRVLICGDYFGINTGFARVNRNLIRGFRERGYEVAQHCWFWYGQTGRGDRDVEQREYGCFRYPVQPGDGFGHRTFEAVVEDWDPDVVVSVGDVWMTDWIMASRIRGRFFWIPYFPLDALPFPTGWAPFVADAAAFGQPAVYSQYAAALIAQVMPDVDVSVIGFGVDSRRFRPLTKVQRQFVRQRIGIGDEQFNIVTVNRNTLRKRYGPAAEAFARLLALGVDAHWHCHGDVLGDVGGDQRTVWRYVGLVGETGKRLSFTPSTAFEGMTDEELNVIYNYGDCAFSLCQEGFGLTTLEAMAAGLPVVIVAGSANSEIIEASGGGVLIPARGLDWTTRPDDRAKAVLAHPRADPAEAAAILASVAADPAWRRKMALAGRRWAKEQKWEQTSARISELVERGTEERRAKLRPLADRLRPGKTTKLLVRETKGGIGDMLSLSVALAALKQKTGCTITVVCKGEADGPRVQMLKRCAGVDKVVAEPKEQPTHDVMVDLSEAASKGELSELRSTGRISSCRAQLYCKAAEIEPPEQLGARLRLSSADVALARKAMKKAGLRKGFVALVARSAESYKDWPAESWAQLAGLLEERGVRFARISQEGDIDETVLGVGGFAALLRCAGCVVSTDTLGAHLAGALGVPGVALFGPSDGRRIKYPTVACLQAENPCSPCWRYAQTRCALIPGDLERSKCMEELPAERVREAILFQMEQAKKEGGRD